MSGFDIGDVLTGLLDPGPEPAAPGPRTPAASPPDPPPAPTSDPTTVAVIRAPDAGHHVVGEDVDLPLFGDTPQPAGPFADWVQAPDTRGRMGWQRPDAPRPEVAWEDLRPWPDVLTPAAPASARIG